MAARRAEMRAAPPFGHSILARFPMARLAAPKLRSAADSRIVQFAE